MATVYRDDDVNVEVLKGRRIGVLGYGNQGRAQALNLRDSGFTPLVGNRDDEYKTRALEEGFPVRPIREVADAADVILVLIPVYSLWNVFNKNTDRLSELLIFTLPGENLTCSCGWKNPESSRFCGGCGSTLQK